MFNRLSDFAQYLLFFIAILAGLILDQIFFFNADVWSFFIWLMPLTVFLILFIVHRFNIRSKCGVIFRSIICGVSAGFLSFIILPSFMHHRLFTDILGAGEMYFLVLPISLIIGFVGGLIWGIFLIFFLDKNIPDISENEQKMIKNKYLLIISLLISLATSYYFLFITETFMAKSMLEIIIQIILAIIDLLCGLLFFINNRKGINILGWRVLSVCAILFSIFLLLKGFNNYQFSKFTQQLPICTDETIGQIMCKKI